MLNDDLLVQTYIDAVKYGLDKEFIRVLQEEIILRGLISPEKQAMLMQDSNE
ncbi:Sporulation inhibitor A [Paenibacillus sp. UNCCL117]|uniref:sporulation histidine kinase inhibitor Sda n=1 Tax=unclassified Paenibacillus TaxID=185978 RepID=UPI00088F3E87|nr:MULTISPECIES: sporulation histidine kinase inhibitor Sda [unclassified Paenibacillus]SDC77593.1 Sporulation inhibitor A [Paenibacillus sp. cl123]SFW25860.1 Sporulation inhibitor A [Paenibacillus sp. UNCCL117]